jgi:beta-fructofuranosidase
MVLTLAKDWIWDFWLADTDTEYHLFFLKAPRIGDPGLRHWNTRVGHAVSTDLTTWQVVSDALAPSIEPAFDDLATWTGSVVRGDDGSWYMFYTGLSRADDGQVQRVGLATSADLVTWRKHGTDVLVSADPRWYHTLDDSGEVEAWRDPWLVRDPDGDGWHMLVTASARDGEVGGRGVLGHAWSTDLRTWRVLPPLSRTDSGFGQLEVPQLAVVGGDPVLLFSCLGPQLSSARREAGEPGGVWGLRPDSLLGPYDVTQATRLTDESLYVGKLVQRRDGRWVLLAFVNQDTDGAFVGSISDPLPVVLPVGSGALLSAPVQVP